MSFLRILSSVCTAALLAGCVNDITANTAMPTAAGSTTFAKPRQTVSEARKLADRGLQSLKNGDTDDASRRFNEALQLAPQDARIHLAAAVTYHRLASTGRAGASDLAETGYQMALRYEPTLSEAARQLATLELENGKPRAAQARLAHAMLIDGINRDDLLTLATASYYARDLGMALWAITEAERLAPGDSDVLRTKAIIQAASGYAAQAQETLAQAKTGDTIVEGDDILRKRLNQWENFYQWAEKSKVTVKRKGPPLAMTVADGAAPAEAAAAAGAAAQAPAAASGRTPIVPKWECDDVSAAAGGLAAMMGGGAGAGAGAAGGMPMDPSMLAGMMGGGGGHQPTANNEETSPLPALAAPCSDTPSPNMVMVDAVLILTDDEETSAQGVNLLDNLTAVIKYSSMRQGTWGNGTNFQDTITPRKGITLGTLTQAGLQYSLNIANATDKRNHVLARPTLVALDRKPSQFFSGSNVSLGISGNVGGSVVDKPTGVSLSITPTFISDDELLLSVKAARSFFTTATNKLSTFSQSLQTSRNTVTANVRMKIGQTLVLSGLSEREMQDASNGVPGLKDIPGVQYLFNHKTSSDTFKSVLVLLTPHRTVDGTNSTAVMEGRDIDDPALGMLRDRSGGFTPAPNIAGILGNLQDNILFTQFRTGDISTEIWQRDRGFDRTLKQLGEILHF